MHKYIHEYDNEWGYFVKIDDDIDEEKNIIINEDKSGYTNEDKSGYTNEDKYKKLIQYNNHDNINKSLFIYFVVTILIYVSYAFSLTYKNYSL